MLLHGPPQKRSHVIDCRIRRSDFSPDKFMAPSNRTPLDPTGFSGVSPGPPVPPATKPSRPASRSPQQAYKLETVDRVLLKYVLQNIREAVLFVGTSQQILAWNRAAEDLLGITREIAGDLDSLLTHLHLGPRQGRLTATNDTSIRDAVLGQIELLQYATMEVEGRPPTPVDIQVVPLLGPAAACLGSLILIHDASYKVNLQRQIQELMAKTISDPLTGVGNRSEFERVLETCVQHYRGSSSDLSLIICDIDFFKSINDTYGHPVGDEALVAFASFLQRSIRDADFLARFGGEEFVIVCNECGGQAAAECAEKIRVRLEKTPLGCLGQKTLSASFGVTQFHPEDTPSTFFARADQALLRAKEDGRNRVVLSHRRDGRTKFEHTARPVDAWLSMSEALVCQQFTSSSPREVLAAKLDGFVQEHQAEIKQIENNRVVIHTGEEAVGLFRRTNDRRTGFKIDLQFQEITGGTDTVRRFGPKTQIQISIGALRPRDRRQSDIKQQADFVMRALRGFLMLQPMQASDDSPRSGR